MAYVLVHEEDWSSYGTDVESVSNVTGPDYGRYVSWEGTGQHLIGAGASVGPTEGPNGGPGIVDLSNGVTISDNIEITCRDFKVELLVDYDGWVGPGTYPLFVGWYGSPYSPSMSEFSDTLFTVTVGVDGNVIMTANPSYNSGNVTDAFDPTELIQWRLEGRISTISGSPGSFSGATDGYLKLYANDVLIVDSGTIEFWHDDANIPSLNAGGSFSPYWNIFELGIEGRLGLWRVYADDSCLIVPTTRETYRNLLTGDDHTVDGSDNVIAGVSGSLTGSRSVLMSLDGSAHSETKDGTLIVWGDIYHNGSPLDLSVDLSDEFDGLGT